MNTIPAVFRHPPCLPWPSPQPTSFRPGTCYTFAPHAAPWWTPAHVTAANFGWYILAGLLIAATLSAVQTWICDRWEITCGRPRIARRWYGTHAQVRLRAEAESDDAPRYVVLAWDDDSAEVPWLKVHRLDPEFCTYWDEDAEPFWAPVTVFVPHAVRRFRPGVTIVGRIPVPWLTAYPLLPYPVRVPQEARDAA